MSQAGLPRCACPFSKGGNDYTKTCILVKGCLLALFVVQYSNKMRPKSANITKDDTVLDQVLRPKAWDDFIGQDRVKRALKVLIDASKKRTASCDHILFYGPAGLGKTTLAYLIAHELEKTLTVTSGPTIKKTGDIAALLTNLEPGDVLFIDEVHRLNKQIGEVLYPAMESGSLHLMIGSGPSARSLELKLPPFTLIAATTHPSLLSNPLRSRFGSIHHLEYYQQEDIENIISRSANLLNITVHESAVPPLAQASRATPRTANRLLKRTWDVALVDDAPTITSKIVAKMLDLLGIDSLGLERIDVEFLTLIAKKFHGGPVGIQTLAVALNEERETLEDLCEPYLIRLGFLERTSRGRTLTTHGYAYLQKANQL